MKSGDLVITKDWWDNNSSSSLGVLVSEEKTEEILYENASGLDSYFMVLLSDGRVVKRFTFEVKPLDFYHR